MSDVLVLCYHAVSETWESELAVTPEQLEAQLSLLVKRGYAGATFSDALLRPPGKKTLAVTFDDGCRSILQLGFPILTSLGLPGSVFVPTDYVGTSAPMSWPGIDRWASGPDSSELLCLSWDDCRSLRDAGWEVGSHTCSHPRLTQLDDGALREELRRSREDCERGLGRPCESIAYPYGDTDVRVMSAAQECGYRVGATLPQRLHAPLPLHWPRVGVYRENSRWVFRAKVSPTRRWLSMRTNRRMPAPDGPTSGPGAEAARS